MLNEVNQLKRTVDQYRSEGLGPTRQTSYWKSRAGS